MAKFTRNERREVREVKHFAPQPRKPREEIQSERIELSPEELAEIERAVAAGEIPF